MDPHCGWCYANSDNILQLVNKLYTKLPFELIVGGMWLDENAPVGGETLSWFIRTHVSHLEKKTNKKVGKRYINRAEDTTYAFNSLQPCAAIQWVKVNYPRKVFTFASKVQFALFVEGKRLDKLKTYQKIMKEMSMNFSFFKSAWMEEKNIQNTREAFIKAATLTHTFPKLFFEENGQHHILASGYFDHTEVIRQVQQYQKHSL